MTAMTVAIKTAAVGQSMDSSFRPNPLGVVPLWRFEIEAIQSRLEFEQGR